MSPESDESSPPPETMFEPTSIDELLELTAFLRADEAARQAFERVGVHGDFTPEEVNVIARMLADFVARRNWRASDRKPTTFAHDFCGAVPFPPLDSTRDPLLLNLAVTLARWIGDGAISGVDDSEARAFLEDRFFQRAGDRSGILTTKATADEVMWMARGLMANSAYWDVVKEVVKRGEFAGIDDDLLRDVVTPLEDAITAKYGLINRGHLGVHSLLRAIAMGKIDSLESPEAWESIRARKMFARD
ncbi:hypothetical protein [Bradyrhizobium sp. OAE829]|uniref:hypothetical protein n=1 Tax=Bradyrhizobium sp. OAE829 TaxID=2663807 RepID=UPI001789F46F